MTPLQANAPQTVLDLLFPPGVDSSVAVVPDLLPTGASEDLDRALQNIPATLRTAAVRETTGAAKGLLNADPIGFLVSGWQKHREVIAAARRTVAGPGIIELVDLATHQITVTQRPAVSLLVDNRQTATIELGLGSGAIQAAAVVTGRPAGHSEVMDWPVLASLPQNERLNLVARLRRQVYRRDEVICHQGDPADTLHLIAAGHVSVRVTLRGGEFVTVAILGPGDTFGEFALVSDAHRRGATVVALETSETLALGRHEFERLRTSYPGIDRFLVELLSARLEKVNNNLLEALYVPAEIRVMRRLLYLCELYAGDDQRITIPVTQETLASIAGTTRPTANQALQRLVASKIVAVNRSQITVEDRSGLQHLASGGSA